MQANAEGLRQFPRTSYTGDVYVMDTDGFGFVLEATDLSRGGVFVRTPLLLEEGEHCFLRFELNDGAAVAAKGHICRTNATPFSRYPAGFAIAFDELDELSVNALEGVTSPARRHVVF